MKTILGLLFCFAFNYMLYGQDSDSINKIRISYYIGHNSWGKSGIYGKEENLEITPITNNEFRITRYYLIRNSVNSNKSKTIRDTINFPVRSFNLIKKEFIKYWLEELNTNRENFTESFLKPELKSLSTKEIYDIAKKNDLIWLLKDRDFDKEDKLEIKNKINHMKNFNDLDSFFINRRPTIEYNMTTIDSYDELRISIIKTNDKVIEYRSNFFEPLGQPIVCYKNKDYLRCSKVFNLRFNTLTRNFLPKKSITYKVLDINKITQEYIRWYLENKM